MDTAKFEENGFAIVQNVLSKETVDRLIRLTGIKAKNENGRGGVRNLLDIAEFRELAEERSVQVLAEAVLGIGAFVVRGILFDKTDATNWKVPWHQDVTIAVAERLDVKGYGPWSLKAGVVHVQPPREVLERMVSVRLHLDDCPPENGALRVIPGTHKQGKFEQERTDRLVEEGTPVTCAVSSGDALLMHPLLLHASSMSSMPRHRRVVHFDYANLELSGGLHWLSQQPQFASEERSVTLSTQEPQSMTEASKPTSPSTY